MSKQVESLSFQVELAALINKYSLEQQSNTPDFILASFLSNILIDWNHAMSAREKWGQPPHVTT